MTPPPCTTLLFKENPQITHNPMSQNKIYPAEWLRNKPYKKLSDADTYYSDLSTKILGVIKASPVMEVLIKDRNWPKKISMTIAGLLEDLISDIGVWKLVLSENMKRYGKPIPFYDTSYYVDGEINPQDVKLIIWDFCQRRTLGTVINPENVGICETAESVYALLDGEWETAPENEALKNAVTKKTAAKDYWVARELLSWVSEGCFLNHRFEEDLLSGIESYKTEEVLDKEHYTYLQRMAQMFSWRENLVCLRPQQILSAICGCDEQGVLEKCRMEPILPYSYKGYDSQYLHLRRFADEKDFNVELSSFSSTDSFVQLFKQSPMTYCNLVNWGSKWYQCGIMFPCFRAPSDKTNYMNRLELGYISDGAKKIYETLRGLFPDKNIIFYKNYFEASSFLNKTFEGKYILQEPPTLDKQEPVAIFPSPRGGIMSLTGYVQCIASPDNPYYDKEVANEYALKLMLDTNLMPYDLVSVLINDGLLPDAKLTSRESEEHGRKLLQDNIFFITDYFHMRYQGDDTK